VGTGSKAGGPNHLIGMMRVAPAPRPTSYGGELESLHYTTLSTLDALHEKVAGGGESGNGDAADFRYALRSVQDALDAVYLVDADVSGLGVEKNVFRYRPTEVMVRLEDPADWWQVAPMLAGAAHGGTKVTLSVGDDLRDTVAQAFRSGDIKVLTESTDIWLAGLADNPTAFRKIRYFGDDPRGVAEAVNGSVDVAIYSDPATFNGRVDLRPFFLEQSVAATNHRFGDHTKVLNGVI